jgi:hypothetical protein
MEIRCPKCSWEPDGFPHWQCDCGYVWNTFDTAGHCPCCGRIWKYTMCPGPGFPGGCGLWSLHIDWYHNLDEAIRKEIEAVLNKELV